MKLDRDWNKGKIKFGSRWVMFRRNYGNKYYFSWLKDGFVLHFWFLTVIGKPLPDE